MSCWSLEVFQREAAFIICWGCCWDISDTPSVMVRTWTVGRDAVDVGWRVHMITVKQVEKSQGVRCRWIRKGLQACKTKMVVKGGTLSHRGSEVQKWTLGTILRERKKKLRKQCDGDQLAGSSGWVPSQCPSSKISRPGCPRGVQSRDSTACPGQISQACGRKWYKLANLEAYKKRHCQQHGDNRKAWRLWRTGSITPYSYSAWVESQLGGFIDFYAAREFGWSSNY